MQTPDQTGAAGKPVDASLYDADYFLTECEGYQEFAASGGHVLSGRLATALSHADVQPGMRVLDVGCGRGESLIWLMEREVEVWGLDYATDALRLAKTAVGAAPVGAGWSTYPVGAGWSTYPVGAGWSTYDQSARTGHSTQGSFGLFAANARRLPFLSSSFDRVLMLDIIEHLLPWELQQALQEAHRVLKEDGKLVVHTAPNLWYYRFGYPLFRAFQRLRGVQLPPNPRQRFRSHQHVHVNEQSPRSLAQALRNAGFRPRIWLTDTQRRWAQQGRLSYVLGWLATHCYPLKWVFCGDILAVASRVKTP